MTDQLGDETVYTYNDMNWMTSETVYPYDGGNPIMDFNGSGSLTMRYLWGPMGIVARQTSGGTISWYLADALGSVRDLINNSGAIIDHIDFSAFGNIMVQSDPSEGDRMMGFAGMEQDAVTGLNLAVFREENPEAGRWDSQDPLSFAAGDSDLYRYTGNGPDDNSDSSGLGWGDFGWGLLEGAGTALVVVGVVAGAAVVGPVAGAVAVGAAIVLTVAAALN